MPVDLAQNCADLIEEIGLGTPTAISSIEPLAGGVSSDIAKVVLGTRRLCVKFALPKLKVAADWQAPVHRNRAEYAWLRFAEDVAPESTVKLFGRSERLHGFAMEFLEGSEVYLWKTALLAEQEIRDEASLVGDLMGRIHARSTLPSFNPAPFQNRDDFYALRIEPYLVYTASKHPALTKPLTHMADNLYQSRQVLVHGDISPKNIIFRDNRPIFLDAECATMGDACFDLAFCLNHLVIKATHLPASRGQLLSSILQLWQAYATHVEWEPKDQLQARVCHLLPALWLARIDGKSPVEYLNQQNQILGREIATGLIEAPCTTLLDLTEVVRSRLALTHTTST